MGLLSSRFNTGTYTVTRSSSAGVAGADGHFTPAATSTLPITGSVQPVSGRALRDLKEGQRADDVRQIYTYTPLFTVDEGHAAQDFIDVPDEVVPTIIRRYRVTKVEYFGVISKHYRATLEKITVP